MVDDDDAIRALVRTVLRRRGFRVDVARNGVEAMDLLRVTAYALIVLDLMMPMMSGYDVLEHLGALPAQNRPYVLVLTAGLEPRTFDTSFVIGTVHKPFDIELLLDTVTGILQSVADSVQARGNEPGHTSLEKPN